MGRYAEIRISRSRWVIQARNNDIRIRIRIKININSKKVEFSKSTPMSGPGACACINLMLINMGGILCSGSQTPWTKNCAWRTAPWSSSPRGARAEALCRSRWTSGAHDQQRAGEGGRGQGWDASMPRQHRQTAPLLVSQTLTRVPGGRWSSPEAGLRPPDIDHLHTRQGKVCHNNIRITDEYSDTQTLRVLRRNLAPAWTWIWMHAFQSRYHRVQTQVPSSSIKVCAQSIRTNWITRDNKNRRSIPFESAIAEKKQQKVFSYGPTKQLWVRTTDRHWHAKELKKKLSPFLQKPSLIQ